ncbi:MAG: glycosyltransferase [Herbaspirillum sp.]|jgi:glycosyltransferase involved in cell wall biosynthesis|nr:glycosyltransferase [Herbaspirillum sp.]
MKLQIVVPCYNEQEVLPEASRQFDALLDRLIAIGKISPASQIVFIDDGSRDGTWALIEHEARQRSKVVGLKLSRNQGHQNAVLAGMMTADGDAIITIDADLQDDIEAIEKMVDRHLEGYDIVYGVRADRSSDTAFKRLTAVFFYRILAFFGVELVHNHADFRLMSRRAVNALREYREVNLYLRGIVPLIGYRSTSVEYDRKERFAGESKYPLSKMLKLAMQAVTSFSTVPLQMITMTGFVVFTGAMAVSAWVLWVSIFTDKAVPGWASTVLPMTMLGGIEILCLGVIGAYLGKIYGEVKSRPRYVIEQITQPSPGPERVQPSNGVDSPALDVSYQ